MKKTIRWVAFALVVLLVVGCSSVGLANEGTTYAVCKHQWIDVPDAGTHITYEDKGVSHDKVTTTTVKCVLCGVTTTDSIRVVEGHDFYQSGNQHIAAKNQHHYYFTCSKCGASDQRIKSCYGPPCNVTYFSVPTEVCAE